MKILTDILIISLFCNGWYLITRHGMALFFLHKLYLWLSNGVMKADNEVVWMLCHKPILKIIYKPLFGCVTCMASIWGSLAYFVLNNFTLSWGYPVVIIACTSVNVLIYRILDILYKD